MRNDVFQLRGSWPVRVSLVVRGKTSFATCVGNALSIQEGILSGVGAREGLVFSRLVESCCSVGMVSSSCDGEDKSSGCV